MNPNQSVLKTRNSLPYWGILFCSLFVTASEVFMKKGADDMSGPDDLLSLIDNPLLLSQWIWLGVFCYIISLGFWIKVLQVLPLNIAFNLVNIEHLFVPAASYLFLDEFISPMRIAGISLVLMGVWLIAETYCRMEERA